MLRVAFCDDLSDARLALRGMVERILEDRAIEYACFEFSSGEGLVGWHEKHAGEVDLVFLDIEMGGINGMEAARQLRARDADLQLVFVTGYTDYVYDGYSVGALGYIIKPPRQKQLEEVLSRALEALLRGSERMFVCRNADGLYRIPRSRIRYFCSDRRQVTCVTSERSYTFYAKLAEVAEGLEEGFVRIHQRYLVNAAAVERMEAGQVVVGGEALPVSRSYQDAVLVALARAALE